MILLSNARFYVMIGKFYWLGPSIKDVRSQGGGEFVQCGHFSDKWGGGFSGADVRTFLSKKLRTFQNLWCVPHGQEKRGLSQCGHFADRGGGSIFRDFVRTPFMDGPFQ